MTISEEKKVENMTLNFFLTVHFHVFFRDFPHISDHISVSIRDIQIISTVMSS